MPDLEELTGFEPTLGAPMLPPAELRRRGDRRRRRTGLVAGGAVAAVVVAIAVPVVALPSGHSHRPQPAPSPAVRVVVTTIPDGFPIATAFPQTLPDGSPVVLDRSSPGVDVEVCGHDALTDRRTTDRAQLHYTGESEDESDRALLVYADDDAAREALSGVRSAVADCDRTPLGNGSTLVNSPLKLDLGGEEAFGFSEAVTEPDGLVSGATVTELVRVGNAVLVESSYGSAGGKWSIATSAALLRLRSQTPLGAMCVFSAEPCTGPPTTKIDDIPDDFGIGVGFVQEVGEKVSGPSSTINGVSFAAACQTQVWPGLGATDRLAVRIDGAHEEVVRELVSYEDSSRAYDTLTNLTNAVAGCAGAQRLDADTGYRDSLTFAASDSTGELLFQVVRVGRTVLATVQSGELVDVDVTAAAAGLTFDNEQVTALMQCTFISSGC